MAVSVESGLVSYTASSFSCELKTGVVKLSRSWARNLEILAYVFQSVRGKKGVCTVMMVKLEGKGCTREDNIES